MENPFGSFPFSDSALYVMRAEGVLGGDWLGKEIASYSGEAFYIYFLAAVFAIFGKNYLAVQIIQHLMGAVSCGIIYLICHRFYGGGVGLIIGLWASLFSPFLFHEGLMLTSAPAILFLLISLYCLILTLESPKAHTGLLGGLFLGLAALCRPNLLLLAPVYFIWIVLKDPRTSLKSLVPYALVLGVFLAVFPHTLKNYIVGKDLVLITSTGGLTFFLGNNPRAMGIYNIPLELGIRNDPTIHISSHTIAEQKTGKKLKPSEVSGFWFGLGLDFIKDSPTKAVALFWKKFRLFWNDLEFTITYKYDFFQKYSPLLRGLFQSFGPLAVMGLLGALWILYSGTNQEKLLPALLFAYMFSVIIFFVTSRLRVPISIFLFLSAGFALKKLKDATLGQRTVAAALSVALILFVYQDVEGDVRKTVESSSFTYYQLARKFTKSKDYSRAMYFLNSALEEDPDNVQVLIDAGEVAEKLGDTGTAKKLYGRVLAGEDLESQEKYSWSNSYQMVVYRALLELGIIYFKEGDYKRAEEYLKTAVSRYPIGLKAHKFLALSYENQGKLKEALAEYDHYLTIYPMDRVVRRHAEELRSQIK
jgi:tetratricopeptide (TPR) repeat protein